MFRILVAVILSFSIALPGIAMASPDHHVQMTASDAGHGHHGHTEPAPCEGDDCEIEHTKICCAMMVGHCVSIGVLSGSDGSADLPLCVSAELFHGAAHLMVWQSFEADPPLPRI